MYKSKARPRLLRIPKAFSILYIAMLTWLSLDAFGENIPFLNQAIQFLVHMVPIFILIGLLAIAWSHPKLGGILFCITSIILTIFFNTYKSMSSFLAISFPLFLIGILFIVFGFIDECTY